MSTDLATLLTGVSTLLSQQGGVITGNINILAGSIDDPDSFDAAGGKSGVLGYYPIILADGTRKLFPCLARLLAIAAGGTDLTALNNLLAASITTAQQAAAAAQGSLTAVQSLKASLEAEFSFQAPISYVGELGDGEALTATGCPQAVTFPANFAGSAFHVRAGAPAAPMVLVIRSLNADGTTTDIGTLTVATNNIVTGATTGGAAVTVPAGAFVEASGPTQAIDGVTKFTGFLLGAIAR